MPWPVPPGHKLMLLYNLHVNVNGGENGRIPLSLERTLGA